MIGILSSAILLNFSIIFLEISTGDDSGVEETLPSRSDSLVTKNDFSIFPK